LIWVAFLIQPFLTLLYAINNYRAPSTKNVMWFFTVFFGLTIAVGVESTGNDIVRYIDQVETIHLAGLQLTDWYNYHVSTRAIDIVQSILALVVAQFTDNGYYMVILYGLIYGYFYSRNMWFVIDRLEGKLSTITIVLIICLFLVVPIWYINGFRFWTATHVFIFGLLPYLYSGKKRSLIWCFLTPFLFHFAFILPTMVLGLFIILRPFMRGRLTIFFSLFLLSIFISEINIQQFNYFIDTYAPEAFAERSRSYRSEELVFRLRNASNIGSNLVWYAAIYRSALHWSLMAFLVVLFLKSRELIKIDTNLERALSFTYFFFAVGNVMSSIPSGGRYLTPAAMLATAIITIYIQNGKHDKLMRRTINFSMPLLSLFIVVSVREGLFLTSIATIIGNPLTAFFTIGDNISLNDILKSLF